MTLIPFEPKLIDYNMLSLEQIDWLNVYNARIVSTVMPVFEEQGNKLAVEWIEARTGKIEIEKENNAAVTNAAKTGFIGITLVVLLSWF